MIQFMNSHEPLSNRKFSISKFKVDEMKKEPPFKMHEGKLPIRRGRTIYERASPCTEYMTELYFSIQADEPCDCSKICEE
jgi:hypothetical protein